MPFLTKFIYFFITKCVPDDLVLWSNTVGHWSLETALEEFLVKHLSEIQRDSDTSIMSYISDSNLFWANMQDIALAVFFTVYSMYLLIIKCNLTKPKQNLLDYANLSRMWPYIRI